MPQLPAAFITSVEQVTGFRKEPFLAVHASGEQVTSVRFNPAKKALLEGEWLQQQQQGPLQQVPWCNEAYYLPQRPMFTFDPLLHGGVYYVQEASSMFLQHMLKNTVGTQTAGLKVLDLCAAPGGKSTLLASYFTDGLLVTNEVIKSRSGILVENMTKWGAANVVVTNNDPKDFTALEGYFDVIVVDAPCSGSGLFRRDAAAIEEWSIDNVALCNQRQQRILADILPALKPGGWLIYATCSYSAEEDEQIMDWLMQSFNLHNKAVDVPVEWNVVATQAPQSGATGYRFFPDRVKGEGFFIAAFQQQDGTEFHGRKKMLPPAGKTETKMAAEWVTPGIPLYYFAQQEHVLAIAEQWQEEVALLQKQLYLRKAGVNIGAVKGKDLVPSHELALSLIHHPNLQKITLGPDDALQYLRRKEFAVNIAGKGWTMAVYQGITLGWMKLLPNRVNNYYPTEWRILKD
ncbi:methyltransferase RsmF C-terminal domain-like protein [Deminuibacter soli]|uniref:RNA methyltransferase n=1 Tax=Deminuibacter soli TaxID=2291815 RepID=A0A3E1NLJ3_9BACT|nr:RNA methyltransferase [Deminuibacter soli]RFM28796.1 RNA methyltransferase [Deminuibacter soli]